MGQAYDPPPAAAQVAGLNPSNLRATSTLQRSVTVAWNEPTFNANDYGISQYEVQWRRFNPDQGAGDNWVTLGTGSQTAVSLTVTGLQPGTKYDFRVRTVALDLSSFQPVQSFWTPALVQQTKYGPYQATNARVWIEVADPGAFPNTAPTYNMTLVWDAPASRTNPDNPPNPAVPAVGGYYVAHVANPGFDVPYPAVQKGLGRRHTFGGLTLNTGYGFYVYACETANDPDTCGRPLAVGAETPAFGPPHEVVGPIVVTGERRLNRNLRSPDAVVHYFDYSVGGVQSNHPIFGYPQWLEVEWSPNGLFNWRGLVSAGGLSDSVNAPLPSRLQSVHVRVRAANAAGVGPWSDAVEVSFTPYINWVSGSAGQNSATLNWSSTTAGSGEIDKYQVHIEEYAVNRDNPGTDYRKTWTDVGASATRYEFTNLKLDKTYIMRVRACKSDGTCTYAVRAYATISPPALPPGPLTNLSMGVNSCRTDFRWRITPPEITETAGKAVHYEFQWRLDSASDDETAWSNLRSGSNPKFRNTSGWVGVPAARETVQKQFGGTTINVERSKGPFHMRVRAVNDHGAGPWINTGESNRVHDCRIAAPLTPVTGESYTDPSGTQPGGSTALNQRASVTVTAADPVDVTEGGSGASYTVVLDGQPIGNVTIATSSDNGDVTTQPASLTFTTGNWDTAQTVTVHAGDDDDAVDDSATISHAVSGADGYAGIAVASVSVSVTDDDTAGITVSESSLSVNEGGSATYTVSLSAQPLAEVQVHVFATNGISVQPAELMFTSSNWRTARTVTVSAAHDNDTSDDTAWITHSLQASAGSGYENAPLPGVLTVSIADDDEPQAQPAQQEPEPGSVTVSAANLPIREGAAAATYTVSLDVEPTENVTITVSSDNGDVTTQPASLTFTTGNWQTAQTVSVSAGQDSDESDDSATLSHSASGGNYDGVTVASVTVSVTDDDSDRAVLEAFYQATGGHSWTNIGNWLSNKPLNQWHGVSTNGSGQVTQLSLRNNGLSGSLPAALGKLDGLQVLSLDRNSISGSLPSELGNLSNLTRLAMNRNSISGAIPSQLGNLSNLSIIGLARNSLSGSLPNSLGNLSGLTKVSLHDNTALSGALPSGFTGLTNLQRLAIANTGLCLPDTQAFDDWLAGVPDKSGIDGLADCASP